MRILVAGGGSGGHLYPAVAILEGFRARGTNGLGYIGARRDLERHVLSAYPWIEAFLIHGRGLPRRPSWGGLFAILELLVGLVQTFFIIRRFCPTVIIGTGGFASFPPLLWGLLLGIPTVVHEVNVVPGLVSRLFAPRADLTLVAYSETAQLLQTRRVAVTGVPLRPELLQAGGHSPEDFRAGLGLDPAKRTVLVLGGSRGAAPLNWAVLSSTARPKDLQVLLITGRGAAKQLQGTDGEGGRGIIMREYLYQMGEALCAADLVISRAGAATLAELTALGRPAVLVPWPGAAENHQELNARFLERAGGAEVLSEKSLGELDLLELSGRILSERERLNGMAASSRRAGRCDGLERVIEEVERLIYTLSASAGRE